MHMSDETIAQYGLADSFIPPYPHRYTERLSVWKRIELGSKNLLATFREYDFQNKRIKQSFLGQTLHVCNQPEGVRETLHQQAAAFEKKSPVQRHTLEPLLGDGLFVSDGRTWAERRKIVAPIVHGRRVDTFAPIMSDVAAEWCQQWEKAGDGATLDVLFEMGELTAEIISRTIFGAKLGRENTQQIIAGFAAYQKSIQVLDWLTLLNLPDWLPRLRSPRTLRARNKVHRVIDDIMRRFQAGDVDERAVIRSLFEARDADGRPLTKTAIRNEAIVIFMAGHETTANTLAWAFYCVSQSPRVQERLKAEFDSVLGGRTPELSDVANLVYTRAVVEETLRLYPPVPLLGREATAKGTLLGNEVNPGDILIVAPWLLQRNRDIWSLPDHFVPERFVPSIAQRPNKYANIPFASGPRVCPGMTFALTEATICLAALLQHFDVRLQDGLEVETDCRLTLRPTSPLSMTIHRRSPAPAGMGAATVSAVADTSAGAVLAREHDSAQ
ncbi:cytochrome P450 [Acuticoccus sediminis]|uniref:cytochrome P450 n=1 Tax=Acuticoccus sediminis TaxID=2184697 RepID=UPI001CFC55BE|nr:cytochrome P450 [Acuticoccus sediminis]